MISKGTGFDFFSDKGQLSRRLSMLERNISPVLTDFQRDLNSYQSVM